MGSNGGGLLRSAPNIFSGSRNKSKQFLADFDGWALLYFNKEVFTNTFKKTVLFLTYLRGPGIDDWVAKRRATLTNTPNNPDSWMNIRADFINTFKDTGEQIVTLNKLEHLSMKQGEVDDYISRFN